MNGAARTLIALLAGLAAGAAARAWASPDLVHAFKALAPIGGLWLRALQMTITPLIFALVVSAVSSWSGSGGGRTVSVMLALLGVLLSLSAAAGLALALAMESLSPIRPGALDFLAAKAAGAHPPLPDLLDQLMGLVPANPVAAAAEGNIAGLVVFALLLGLALGRLAPELRQPFIGAVAALGAAMVEIVGWVLRLAPVGVFVLASGVALNAGLAAVGALLQLEALRFIAPIVGIGLCYLVARLGGRVGLTSFARAAAGPQAVAAGTCSSMATLPAMIEAAEQRLGLSPALAGSVLPLAVSVFRFGNVILISSMTLFSAWAAGGHPSAVQIALGVLVIILTNVGIAGVPAAAVMYASTAPGFEVMGAPLALIPLFIGTAALSDVFDTACNVTGDLAATTVIARMLGQPALPPMAPQAASTIVILDA